MSNSNFKELELVVPFWKSIKIEGGPATRALLELGPNVIDPKAVAEASISRKEAEELRDLLNQMLSNEHLSSIAFYIRDPKKPVDPSKKDLFDFADEE